MKINNRNADSHAGVLTFEHVSRGQNQCGFVSGIDVDISLCSGGRSHKQGCCQWGATRRGDGDNCSGSLLNRGLEQSQRTSHASVRRRTTPLNQLQIPDIGRGVDGQSPAADVDSGRFRDGIVMRVGIP